MPASARPDRGKDILVGIANSRYPERVRVELLKSVAGGGFTQVGVLTQSVPVKAGRKTTDFPFRYTFTDEDAEAGRVTFEAIATLFEGHDALPADNTSIALPTKVNP